MAEFFLKDYVFAVWDLIVVTTQDLKKRIR